MENTKVLNDTELAKVSGGVLNVEPIKADDSLVEPGTSNPGISGKTDDDHVYVNYYCSECFTTTRVSWNIVKTPRIDETFRCKCGSIARRV